MSSNRESIILILADNEAMRALLTRLFSEDLSGVTIVSEPNHMDAYDRWFAHRQNVRAIVADNGAPNGFTQNQGIRLANRIHTYLSEEEAAVPYVPLVLLCDTEPTDKLSYPHQESPSSRQVRYVLKPFDNERLVKHVQEMAGLPRGGPAR